MQFGPDNKVVQLCAEGMNAEGQGNIEAAKRFFQSAWDIASNDFEAFTAAHYLARNQDRPEDVLYWNEESLRLALAVGGDGMQAYYPSLYLNVAKSYETLHNNLQAAKYYGLAAESATSLTPGKYAEMIRMGISEGLKRTSGAAEYNLVLDRLIDDWCNRKELKPLAIILPAYIGNQGTENDTNKLISSLHYLGAARCLSTADQQAIEALIHTLTQAKPA